MIPKKHSRKIIVDNIEYYWMLSKSKILYKKDNNIENINLYIQKSDNSQLLKVPLKGKVVDKSDDNSFEFFQKSSLSPSDVKEIILTARDLGWMENNKKTLFIFNKTIKLSKYWVEEISE